MQTSNSYQFNKIDFKKTVVHFLIVAASAGITYLLGDVIPNLEVPSNYAIVVTIVSTALKALQRFLSAY